METERREEQGSGSRETESTEEFRDEMENDPSRASSEETEDTDLDRLRGG